jgi:hypothetical protein
VAVIDFREIPQAKGGEQDADTWELFARDFFAGLGLEIEVGPGRGADAGRDLLVVEEQRGQVSGARVRWVVSCKHFAHSGDAVSERHEPSILERVKKFKADGFIGFYSTLPTSALLDTSDRLREEIRFSFYDRARIEGLLVADGRLRPLMGRYFAESFQKWQEGANTPVEVWKGYTPLACVRCGQDLLLAKPYSGLVGWVRDADGDDEHCEAIYWACKGACDRAISAAYWKRRRTTRWEDVSDLTLPAMFMRFVMGVMNTLRDTPDYYSADAFDKLKELILILSQVVVRRTSDAGRERIVRLDELPEGVLLP